jgi:hypothetical protein
MFGSVVAVAFQNVFRVEMHQNDVFSFFKITFKISVSKRSKTYKKIKFFINASTTTFTNAY